MMFYLITMNIHKCMMLPCMPFNVVFGRSAILHHDAFFYHNKHSEVHDATMCFIEDIVAILPDDVYLITTYIHKSMMLPYLPFNVVFCLSAILPDNILFDHHVQSELDNATMHAI